MNYFFGGGGDGESLLCTIFGRKDIINNKSKLVGTVFKG